MTQDRDLEFTELCEIYMLDGDSVDLLYPHEDETGDGEISIEDVFRDPSATRQRVRTIDANRTYRSARAYWGWPDVIVFVGEAVAAGVVGNAASDLIKVAVKNTSDKLFRPQRFRIRDTAPVLTEEQATALAKSVVLAWRHSGKVRLRVLSSQRDKSGRWVVRLRHGRTEHVVTISAMRGKAVAKIESKDS